MEDSIKETPRFFSPSPTWRVLSLPGWSNSLPIGSSHGPHHGNTSSSRVEKQIGLSFPLLGNEVYGFPGLLVVRYPSEGLKTDPRSPTWTSGLYSGNFKRQTEDMEWSRRKREKVKGRIRCV